ncbi:K(+)-insensitive pyrophosphate-energized proton pump [Planctomycetales bacterium]|nr:K(+)-insensitive pyrophosphate-energized proton pump [Planctomycetales bacterium]
MKNFVRMLTACGLFLLTAAYSLASEADLKIPSMAEGSSLFGMNGFVTLCLGLVIVVLTFGLSLYYFQQVKGLEVHKRMSDVANIIYATCCTYLGKQILFLVYLFFIIGAAFAVYVLAPEWFGAAHAQHNPVILIGEVLLFTLIGIAGSTIVAWYGIRLNTYANARTAFASLKGKPWGVVNIPLQAGMSVGLFLISLELIVMVIILLLASIPNFPVGICFLGFALGESLGASALRIAGGIFTKIADIGSDLMKIVFKVGEDDPRNPGVIADCTGDNAGDSVGPTADGFETYGVTGVALISFIVLAITPETVAKLGIDLTASALQAQLITWIFFMRILMGFLSGVGYLINQQFAEKEYANKTNAGAEDFEKTLTNLIWIAAGLCIVTSFLFSFLMLGHLPNHAWVKLAGIITCGTLAAVLIPEFTKIFTSSKSKHVQEVVTASREGGASLNILSGITAGNFSAFWTGGLIAALMAVAYAITLSSGFEFLGAHAPIFAFGLVAFGFLGMGPVTIAVDSYGPVTDNAQSIFELSQIESQPGIKEEIKKDYGFEPDFEMGKHLLEANDGAGNTFKATAKPVLIGTAVAGATTMIFAIILMLERLGILHLDLTEAPVILGLICGGAVIFWFSGAATQAVTTGAYEAVEFIKRTFDMNKTEADIEDAKNVVAICTKYAQKGMWNIFLALFSLTLAFAFIGPNFFVAYLVSIAIFGLFQAIYMANAGGAWDNAKKVVEVDLKQKGTELHAASVIGDTVGDPFKDTSSVALNPIIKFSTLFGLLATEIALAMNYPNPLKDDTGTIIGKGEAGAYASYTWLVAGVFLAIGLYFVWRSFYKMRIPVKS